MFFNEGANVHKNFDFYGILRDKNLNSIRAWSAVYPPN